jgi:hypothetical protein
VRAVTTGVVFVVLVVTKFARAPGWSSLPSLLVFWLRSIHRHYGHAVAAALSIHDLKRIDKVEIARYRRRAHCRHPPPAPCRALKYSRRLASQVRAVTVVTDDEQEGRLRRRWNSFPGADPRHLFGCHSLRISRHPFPRLIEYIEQISEAKTTHPRSSQSSSQNLLPRFLVTICCCDDRTANLLRMRLLGHE